MPHRTNRRFRRRWVTVLVVSLLGFAAGQRVAEPPRLASVPADFTIVDLRPFVNMGWRDERAGDGVGGWSDQGENDMRNAPLGLRNCRGVPFRLIDPADNDGKSVLVLKSRNFPAGLDKLTVPLDGAKAEYVYVLQAAAYLDGGAAKFTLVYEDGTRSDTLQAWENIRICDWWSPEDGSKYKVAFVSRNPVRDRVGMVAMQWKNESPDKRLRSLVIESYNNQTVTLIGAVTLSRKPDSVFKGESPAAVAGALPEGEASDSIAEHEPLPRRYVRDQTERFGEMLQAEDAAGRIIADLTKTERQDALDAKLEALGQSLQNEKAYEVADRMVDGLQQRGDTASAILAADVLLKAVDAVKLSSYGATDEVRDFPDALCDRAAALLEHPSPIVQAMTDWTLALRAKKLDGSTRKIAEMYLAAEATPGWYRQWQDRPAALYLTDDYARQLVHLNRHRTVEGVQRSVEEAVDRLERMLTSPRSQKPPEAAMEQFRTAVNSAKAAFEAGELARAHRAYLAVRQAARPVIVAARAEFPTEGLLFFTNPRIPGGVWNVNVPVTGRTNTPFGDIHHKPDAEPASEARALIDKQLLGHGAVRGIDLHWDADRALFSYWHKPIDGSMPFGWNVHGNAHLYEMNLATGALKQLTDSAGDNDIEPCFLPDGGYIFASDRSSYGNQCAGPFLQDKRCTTLYRLPAAEGGRPVAISNNKDFDRHPHVLNDGTVVFMHWEYQERSLYYGQNAWRCRPDGTNMDAFYKQHITVPYSIRDVQQAPGSEICVATIQGHHDAQNGPVVVFNPSLGINNLEAMKLVTPGCSSIEGGLGPVANQLVAEGGVANRGGSYINPFPMSEQAFLVGHDMTGNEVDFALYYIDVWGHKELLHRDPRMSAFQPHPMRRRETPPVVADTVDPEKTYALAFVEDVYRDLPGVEAGAVKYLRLSQRLMLPAPVDYNDPEKRFNHLHWLPGDATASHFAHWTWAPSRTIGTVKVEDDGSAFFKVPAGTPVFLQALDADRREVRRMRTSFTLQRGEFRSCTGCHETRHETVGTQPNFPIETLQKGPQTPEPPAWGDRRVLSFERDIQPIFDRHCVSCHGRDEPAGGVELTDRKIGGYAQSYRALFGLKPTDPTPIKELDWHVRLNPDAADDAYIVNRDALKIIRAMEDGAWPGMLVSISDRHDDMSVTMPYQFGSNRSRLIQILYEDEPHRAARQAMTSEQWRKLVTWIDYNANYHSTVIDKSQWRSREELTRVPIYLPSPLAPGDTNPTFLNRLDSSFVPPIYRTAP